MNITTNYAISNYQTPKFKARIKMKPLSGEVVGNLSLSTGVAATGSAFLACAIAPWKWMGNGQPDLEILKIYNDSIFEPNRDSNGRPEPNLLSTSVPLSSGYTGGWFVSVSMGGVLDCIEEENIPD